MAIFTRFGNKVTLIEKTRTFEYVTVTEEDGAVRTIHISDLRADNGSAEIDARLNVASKVAQSILSNL